MIRAIAPIRFPANENYHSIPRRCFFLHHRERDGDGYELFLNDLLLGHYGKDCAPNLRISFHEVEGKQVCRIIAQRSRRAIWVREGADEHLYIRAGNSTRRLTTKEAIEYCKNRFASR